MRLALLSLLLTTQLLHGQSEFSDYRWQHFQILDQATAVAETADAIWFASPNYLTKTDKESGSKIETGIAALPELSPLRYDNLAVTPNGNLIIQSENNLIVQNQDDWILHEVPIIFGLFKVEKLVRQEPDGSYLFTGPSIDIFRWKPGSQPSAAEEYQDLTPWRIARAVWSSPHEQLWVTNGSELGYIQDDFYVPVELPQGTSAPSAIRKLHIDRDGHLWVQTEQHLLQRNGVIWTRHLLPEDIDSDDVSFATLGQGQALVVSPGRKILLQPGSEWFDEVDYSDELTDLIPSTPFHFDNNGKLWFINENRKAIGQWQREQEISWQTTSAWLPLQNEVVHLNKDTENRIWITDGIKTYFYSAREWWPANRLYPDFPDSVRQIIFTKDCSPIVMTSPDLSGINSPFRIQVWNPQGWASLPDDNVGTAPLLSGATKIYLDRQERLWVKLIFNTGYQVWERGVWNTIVPTDFFPSPGRLLSLTVNEQGEQIIMTNRGRIRRLGQTYEQIPYSQLLFTEPFANISAATYSPNGTLWTSVNHQLSKWPQEGEEQRIPIKDEWGNDIGFSSIVEIYPFADDDLWLINLFAGASHYNGQFWTLYDGSNHDLASRLVHSLAKDGQGRIWFGARTGISVLTPNDRLASAHEEREREQKMAAIPNPACCQIQLSWQQIERKHVQLALFDSQGRQLRTVLDQILPAGDVDLMIHRENLTAGVYFLVRTVDGHLDTTPIVWK